MSFPHETKQPLLSNEAQAQKAFSDNGHGTHVHSDVLYQVSTEPCRRRSYGRRFLRAFIVVTTILYLFYMSMGHMRYYLLLGYHQA
jgi:hypothetical protein